MTNPLKRIFHNARSHLQANVIELIKQTEENNNEHFTRLKEAADELKGKQAAIEQGLSALLNDLNNNTSVSTGKNEILVKLFNGLKIYLDTRDLSVTPHLALDHIWEPNITKAWISLVKPEDTVMDLGANFGYYGLLAAAKTDKKNSKIIFFEANKRLIPYIHKTLKLNWYHEQSVVENFAVSDRKETVTLNVLKDYIGSSTLQALDKLESYMHGKMELKIEETLKVQSVTIDEYCKRHDIDKVDLIKMDIEGFEEKAYKGMHEIIKASPTLTLFVEFTKESYENAEQFYNQMLNDFGAVYIISENGELKKPLRNTYNFVIGNASDWVMLVFSKNINLSRQVKLKEAQA